MVMVLEGFVLLSRGGNPWLLCAFDIRGYEACMRVSLQSRDREMEPLIYTFHMARRYGERSIGNSKETPNSPIVFARAQNTADGQVAKGVSEVGVHLEICLELGANYLKLLL